MEGDEGGWKYAGVRVLSADFGLVFRSTAILFERPYFCVLMGVCWTGWSGLLCAVGSYAGAGGRCAQVARKAAKCRGKRGNTDKKTGAFVKNRLRFTRKKRECLFMSFFFGGICQGLYTQRFLGVARRPRPRVLEVSKERLKRKRNY